jgi:hypothetical protein
VIPQERIHDQVRDVRDEIAKETNPQSIDAALAIRALEPATTQTAACMSAAAGDSQAASELTDPQYAVVKQLRIPVAVVITVEIEGIEFRRFERVARDTYA